MVWQALKLGLFLDLLKWPSSYGSEPLILSKFPETNAEVDNTPKSWDADLPKYPKSLGPWVWEFCCLPKSQALAVSNRSKCSKVHTTPCASAFSMKPLSPRNRRDSGAWQTRRNGAVMAPALGLPAANCRDRQDCFNARSGKKMVEKLRSSFHAWEIPYRWWMMVDLMAKSSRNWWNSALPGLIARASSPKEVTWRLQKLATSNPQWWIYCPGSSDNWQLWSHLWARCSQCPCHPSTPGAIDTWEVCNSDTFCFRLPEDIKQSLPPSRCHSAARSTTDPLPLTFVI